MREEDNVVGEQEEETRLQYAQWSEQLDSDPSWVSHRFSDWSTLLHAAAEDEQESFAEKLLHLGLDVNARDGTSRTALHRAARTGCIRLIDLLIRHGAELECRDQHGYTPLRQAAFSISGNAGETIELLLRHGAALDLNTAYEYGRRDYVRDQIRANPSSFRQAPAPNDLLTLAVLMQDWELVRLLLDTGADINGRASSGLTPLIVACGNETTPCEMVQMLLDHGANPAVVNGRDGKSAADAATDAGRPDLFVLLTQRGTEH